jgi:LuxR family transcriptional regulator, maltose regulon positive regulatory protein
VESEFLTQISSSERAFLTRTAVLERMSGPLCEAVLETGGSAAVLAALARSNLLLVPPVPGSGIWVLTPSEGCSQPWHRVHWYRTGGTL